MTRVVKRLLVFFIAIPLIVGLVLFLPFYSHLPLNIVVIIYSALGAVEFSAMLEKKNLKISKKESFIFGALAPAALTLVLSFNCPQWIIPLLIMAGAIWVLLSRVFSSSAHMDTAANYMAAGFAVLVYPGFFMYWLIKMSAIKTSDWENGIITLIFLMIILGSDASAWLFGTLFGTKNRGIIPASPNKSIAGFIGEVFGSIVVSGGAALIVPDIFATRTDRIPVLCMALILGICTGIAAALGDLAESALKRSCDVKDSGNLMLGRGGILDSIDSIAFASPVFFLLFKAFFTNS